MSLNFINNEFNSRNNLTVGYNTQIRKNSLDSKTLNCFLKVKIKKKERVGNPDIENKITEGRYKIKKFIKNNFKIWDGYGHREINIHKGRIPSPMQKMIDGMKNYFFGPSGKITKKVPILKNAYLREQNKKIRKMKILNQNANSENNKSVLNPNFLKLKLSDFLKDIPPEERTDLIKKTGLAFKKDEKGRRGGIFNANSLANFVNLDLESIQKGILDSSDSTVRSEISSEKEKSRPKTKSSNKAEITNLKSFNHFANERIKRPAQSGMSVNDLRDFESISQFSPTKINHNSNKNENKFLSPPKLQKSSSQPILGNLNLQHLNSTHSRNNIAMTSDLTSRPWANNRLTNSSTFFTKTLSSPSFNLFKTLSQTRSEIATKYKEINHSCFQIDKNFSDKIRKLKSPFDKRKKLTDEIDKEVIQELNYKFLKNKQDIRDSGGFGFSAVKVRGQFQNIETTKANLIKIADNISKMNEETALFLADKLAIEYESKAVNAAVDEDFEFKKNYNNEMKVKCSNTKMKENSSKMRKLHYNIFQKSNKIREHLTERINLKRSSIL